MKEFHIEMERLSSLEILLNQGTTKPEIQKESSWKTIVESPRISRLNLSASAKTRISDKRGLCPKYRTSLELAITNYMDYE